MLFDDSTENGGHGFRIGKWAEENDTHDEFSAVSLSAIFALLGGVLSSLYLVNRSFWPIPVIALLITLWSLRKIYHAEGRLTGMTITRLALVLILIPLTAAPIQRYIYRRELIRQAREFFPLVIQAAQKGDSLALMQFQKYQPSREEVTNESDYWKTLFSDPVRSMEGVSLIQNKIFVTLLNLGENASVTYDRTVKTDYEAEYDVDRICCLYAVTYSEHGKKKTFLFPMQGGRYRDKKNGTAFWRCDKYHSFPVSFKGNRE